jgi:hypothetical protein
LKKFEKLENSKITIFIEDFLQDASFQKIKILLKIKLLTFKKPLKHKSIEPSKKPS